MNKKFKALIAIGGTGGHVFPGCCLADHLISKKYEVELVTDRRGFKYLQNFNYDKVSILSSSPFNKKNFFTKIYSLIIIFYSIVRSLIYLTFNRPSIIFGMGGYASFPICIAASMLKIKFIIYENNLIIGKANKYLLPFAKKIFVAFEDLEGISKKYQNKIFKTGNIIKKEIINFSKINGEKSNKKISILILGGSQAAKIFAEVLPNIFLKCSEHGISMKIYQHCLPFQNEKLSSFYTKANIEYKLFNFSNNLIEYFSRVDFAITRSGSSILAELTNANIPFVCVPLPTSADNHQIKNAIYYKRKNLAFLIEEKDLNDKLLYLINQINENNAILSNVIQNQRQFSDENVYNNIDHIMREIIDEKN